MVVHSYFIQFIVHAISWYFSDLLQTILPSTAATETTPLSSSLDDLPLRKVLQKISDELRKVARRQTNSKLRDRNFDGLNTFLPEQIADELRTMCPLSYKILSEMLELDCYSEQKIAPLTLIYGIIMFKRCRELSYFQRLNSLILADSSANTEVK